DTYWQTNAAALMWKTFADEEYSDWNSFRECRSQVPLRSLFSYLAVKPCPVSVGNLPHKKPVAELLEEQVDQNMGACACIQIGDNHKYQCIPNLLRCFSVWFSHRDWRTTQFAFDELDLPPAGFEALYEWMRTQKVPDPKWTVPALQAAKHLKVHLLEAELWKVLSHESVREKAAFRAFQQAASLPELGQLRELMLARLRNFFLPLVGSPEFLELPVEALEQLLKRNSIGVNSEMEVFFTALRWLGHRPRRVPERLQHLRRLMGCVRFEYLPMSFLFSLRESCQRADKRDLFRPDPVLLALNSDPQTLAKLEDAMAFIGTRCQYDDTDQFLSICARHSIKLTLPRHWLYHRQCPYHLTKLVFPHRHSFTASDFGEFLASLQEDWAGDGPEDWGRSQIQSLEPDALLRRCFGRRAPK
ncbi:hypothetical protein KR009_003500, partial [Drosophila setifemur]